MIMYSTHSHYMIDPRWLEGSFIVFNDAIDYDDNPAAEPNPKIRETAIHVQKYRDYVGQNPTKSTYFQPILDRLDYAPSKMELGLDAVFVEGKNDFYMLAYFNEVIFKGKYVLRFIPSSGANELGPLISLYLGWGKKFFVLLDDDQAGRIARNRYREEWSLSDFEIITIAEILPNLKNRAMEKILSVAGRKIISDGLEKKTVTKKDIARFFQECFAQNKAVPFDTETLTAVETLLSVCAERIA